MDKVKIRDVVNNFRKEFVYEQYTRLVKDFKDYEKISRVKMIDEIYKIYSDYRNIIDICTVRELKYLEMVLNNKKNLVDVIDDTLDKKYDWKRETLRKKFILRYNHYRESMIYEEFKPFLIEALRNVNWTKKKKTDKILEVMIGYCKVMGTSLLSTLVSFATTFFDIDEIDLVRILDSRLFNYYVFVINMEYDGIDDVVPLAVYNDCLDLVDEINEERMKYKIAGVIDYDLKQFKTIFYNDFDTEKVVVKKLLDEINKYPFLDYFVKNEIIYCSLLNLDRRALKDGIRNLIGHSCNDINGFFKILDNAMDEMPSGVLNGCTPREARKILEEEKLLEEKKKSRYVKQQNACLSKKDAKLFYKIYFGLLEFTNNKFGIVPGLKLYGKLGIDPYMIKDIVKVFWENKDLIVLEFCMINPYKFDKDELHIASEFKKGIRDFYIIARYEKEYTGVMNKDKVYMIKGINDNIDNVISYMQLPYGVETSIIPFKGYLIYDGIFMGMNVKMGNNFNKMVDEEYERCIKYYHM